jgi:Zn-dependent peptidase ImmA (M78 family)
MNIKQLAVDTAVKHHTTNPFTIAKKHHVIISHEPLGNIMGYHNYDSRSHFIHLNQDLSDYEQIFTCAHELGHVLLHPRTNTSFLRRNTLFSVGRIEREASTFAVELLLPDTLILEHTTCSLYDLAKIVGIPKALISLKNCKQCPTSPCPDRDYTEL